MEEIEKIAQPVAAHAKLVMDLYRAGLKPVEIHRELVSMGLKVSDSAVRKWIKRRLVIVQAQAAAMPAVGASTSAAQIPQPVQTPAAAPSPEKSTPSAVPAAGAPKAVLPANPAASLKPKLGRDDVDLSALDDMIAAGAAKSGLGTV